LYILWRIAADKENTEMDNTDKKRIEDAAALAKIRAENDTWYAQHLADRAAARARTSGIGPHNLRRAAARLEAQAAEFRRRAYRAEKAQRDAARSMDREVDK
jgi:hypothetical protein